MSEQLSNTLARLADEAGKGALDILQGALLSGRLSARASINEVLHLLSPHRLSPPLLEQWLQEWRAAGHEAYPPAALALALQSARQAADLVRNQSPQLELVWTGEYPPNGVSMRPTPAVILEMLVAARHRVLVVGYDLREASERIIQAIMEARRRGCMITIALHDNGRNRQQLADLWPGAVGDPMVQVLRWRGFPGDEKASLHAKVLAVDEADLLITSANLTFHGLERNMELGIRIRGQEAWQAIRHFALLEENRILIPYTLT